MKKHFIFLLVVFLSVRWAPDGYAQKQGGATPSNAGQAFIDSILKELPNKKEDTGKVTLLGALSFSYSRINPDEGIKYGGQALALATKLDFKKGIASANAKLGTNYYSKSNYQQALEYYNIALKGYGALGDKNAVADIYMGFGNVSSRQSDPVKALVYFQRSLKLYEETGNKNGAAMINGNIGVVYGQQSDYSKALEYFFKVLKIDEETGNKHAIGNIASNIGLVYRIQGDYDKALEYELKALKVDEETGDKHQIANVTGNIGSIYFNRGDYPHALEYDLKALKIHQETGDKHEIANITGSIGLVYYQQSNYPKALEYDFKALKIDEEIGNKEGISICAGNIGTVYGKQGDDIKALEYYLKALKIAQATGAKDNIAIFTGNIGDVYKKKKDYAKALEYQFKALGIAEEIGDKKEIANITGNIGEIHTSLKNYKVAIEYEQTSLKMSVEMGEKLNAAWQLDYIGHAYLSLITDTAKQSTAAITSELPTGKYRSGQQKEPIPKDKAGRLRNAIEYLQRGLAMGTEIKAPAVEQECYQYLAEAYKLTGNYKQALEATNNYQAIKDTIFSKENNEKIVKMGMKNEYDRQRLADSLKTVEKEKIAHLKLQRQQSYTYMGVAGIALLLGFSFFLTKERRKSERERKKSDGLLLNILPEEVANELKLNGTTKARHFDNVTVLFTDFVNFTSAGERMSPQALIDELHNCFKAFDEITGKYNIEKIKTIGDAYLAVSGLPAADPDHAENMVRAAMEISSFMNDRQAKVGERTFGVRIGIHSGSLVAGIVGVKKFAYDIWGDTVNTAARMEQNSEAGKINVSETTYELVKNRFDFEYRGEIDAKNKGKLKMYFVNNRS